MLHSHAQQRKRVILVFWKKKPDNPFEVFSNLKNFCLSYEAYNYNTLNNYLSKAKTAFENDDIRVERKQVILNPKNVSTEEITNKVVPVIRKVQMKLANDDQRDFSYWITKTPIERMQAVKILNRQFYGKQTGIDKTRVIKRKIRI